MSEPLTHYEGILRPKITIIGLEEARVDWINPEETVIWSETVKPQQTYSFMSQITCEGSFTVSPGYFIDSDNKRHFVMKCDVGRLGALFGEVNMFNQTTSF